MRQFDVYLAIYMPGTVESSLSYMGNLIPVVKKRNSIIKISSGERTDRRINGAACETGAKNFSYFTEQLRRHFGYAPSALRRRV